MNEIETIEKETWVGQIEKEEELPAELQCLSCWHRWRLSWYAPVEPCPKCGSMRQIYVEAIRESLRDE